MSRPWKRGHRLGLVAAAAAHLSACAGFMPASPAATPAAIMADTTHVDPASAQQFEGALRAARWRLLRALDEGTAERWDEARQELDEAFRTLATVNDIPALDEVLPEGAAQDEVDATAAAVERAYLDVLPHIDRLSPDSPLSLLLNELAEEQLQELPPDAVPLVRIHQLASRCDLPIDANRKVAASIHFFQTRGRKTWQVWTRRSGRYRDVIVPILREAGLPQDLFYLAMIESGFNPRAYSRSRAVGLWQFMRTTGRLEGLRIDNWVDERRDPVKSTRAAVRHLQSLYDDFGDWRLAAAAYNAGRGRVRRAIEAAGTNDFWRLDLPRETRNYVPLLMAAAVIAKDPQRFGFDVPEVDAPLEWEQVKLDELIDLKTAARLLDTTVDRLRRLNPELRNLFTPHRPRQGYLFNVPRGRGDGFLTAFHRLPRSQRRGIYEYKVARGDNLWTIARAFDVSVSALADANDLGNAALIHPGQTIYVPVSGARRAPAGSAVHTVRRGETLSAIAQRYHVSVRDLKAWNSLTSHLIHPGQRLAVGPRQLTARQRVPMGNHPDGRPLHTVRAGESLWTIARRYRVSVDDLKAWNALADDLIRPGQSLVVSPAPKERSYTVSRGDTLYSIARRFGVAPAEIARQNHMSLSSTLVTGMELHIPTQQQMD